MPGRGALLLRALVGAWLIATAIGQANPVVGPGASLALPLLSWPIDGGRFTLKLAQGSDDRTLLTRLVFTDPPPFAKGDTGFTNQSRTYPALAVRASDALVMSSVSEAPHPLMRRTRVATRASEHYLQVAAVRADSRLVSDWTFVSRWRAVLFIGLGSGLWDHFRCWHISQEALDELRIEASAGVCAGWTDASAVVWPVRACDYSVPRDASGGDGVIRVHTRRYGAMHIGHAHMRGDNADGPRYPVIVDLESRRNYLPSALDFMDAPPQLVVVPHGGAAVPAAVHATIDLRNAALAGTFTVNTDSPEIVLGMPFFRRNFTTATYDAVAQTLAVTWGAPEPSEALRAVVSLLTTLQGMLIVRWLGSKRIVNMALVADTLRAAPRVLSSGGALLLPFYARQIVYEVLGVFLSGATLVLVALYVGADFKLLLVLLVVQWVLHALCTLAFLGLAPNALRAVVSGLRDSEHAVPMAPGHVIARHSVHVALLGHGIVAGLLLSNDSLVVMMFALAVSLALVYHLVYYLSALFVCTIALAPVSPGRTGWFCRSPGWTLYFLLELLTAAVITLAFQRLLLIPVLAAVNNFYRPVILAALAAVLQLSIGAAATFMVLNEVTLTVY